MITGITNHGALATPGAETKITVDDILAMKRGLDERIRQMPIAVDVSEAFLEKLGKLPMRDGQRTAYGLPVRLCPYLPYASKTIAGEPIQIHWRFVYREGR